MSSKSTEIQDIEEIAQQAHLGAEVSEYFTGHFQAKQQINIALPLELLVCAEKIRDLQGEPHLKRWLIPAYPETHSRHKAYVIKK